MTTNNLSNVQDFTQLPPKPPNPSPMHLDTFKSKLLASEQVTDLQMEYCVEVNNEAFPEVANNDEIGEMANGIKIVFLSKEETERLCSPWRHSLIIKFLGKKTTHQYLRDKLVTQWKVTYAFPLIDLRLDFYIAKFTRPESVSQVLQNGPWFFNRQYLSIKNWELNFVPQNERMTYFAVCVRLPHLLTKFYDVVFLKN